METPDVMNEATGDQPRYYLGHIPDHRCRQVTALCAVQCLI